MSKDKILILGKGFIGSRLQEAIGCPISEAKITSYKDAEAEFKKFSPEIIINSIGHIGVNVDECEKDIDKTLFSNAFLPLILAELAAHYKVKLVHVSSGCIYHFDYSGKKQKHIVENIQPDYFSLFYSRTKIYSERALDTLIKEYPILIVRIRIPLDNRPHPKNILDKLINYKNIIDIPNSITYIPDFIEAMKFLIEKEAIGTYNIVNKGALKYPELMDVYRKYKPDFKYTVVDYKDLGLERTNLILSTRKLENTGFKVRDIHEVLEECVQNYIKY